MRKSLVGLPFVESLRSYSAQKLPKRFYKEVSVVSSGDGNGSEAYEICLDQRKLRTPAKTVLSVPSLPLAHAIAKEWDSQQKEIQVGRMHLFGLTATAIDNPNRLSSKDIVERLVDVLLPSDTILFFESEGRIRERQETVWRSFLDWLAETAGMELGPSPSLDQPHIPEESRELLRAHLAAFSFPALTGYVFGAEAIKSVLLMYGALAGRLSVTQAVQASLLESDFQQESWGSVEWAHDVDRAECSARLAAAVLFVHFHSATQGYKKTLRASQ